MTTMTTTWADLLDRLPTLSQAQTADLKIDDEEQGVRVWLARTGVEDGEPFPRTVYVEMRELGGGRWHDVGYFDGDEPDPAPVGDLGVGWRLTRQALNLDH